MIAQLQEELDKLTDELYELGRRIQILEEIEKQGKKREKS